jgi:hypothetical protein
MYFLHEKTTYEKFFFGSVAAIDEFRMFVAGGIELQVALIRAVKLV